MVSLRVASLVRGVELRSTFRAAAFQRVVVLVFQLQGDSHLAPDVFGCLSIVAVVRMLTVSRSTEKLHSLSCDHHHLA